MCGFRFLMAGCDVMGERVSVVRGSLYAVYRDTMMAGVEYEGSNCWDD